jgi:hypothetical protein
MEDYVEMGNFAGLAAPVLGGLILQRTGGDWNPLIYLVIGATMISAAAWIYLDPAASTAQTLTSLRRQSAPKTWRLESFTHNHA